MTPKEIWEHFSGDAVWEVYDYIDAYTKECDVSLEYEGYQFYGTGTIVCGEKIIQEMWCTTPEGVDLEII